MPLRVYSATMNTSAQTDPVLLRALQRLKLEASGLSLKPLALYAFAGAPRIDHVVMLGAELPAATRLALGEIVDVRRWTMDRPALGTNRADAKIPPGPRYLDLLRLAETLKPKVKALITELTHKDGLDRQPIANSA